MPLFIDPIYLMRTATGPWCHPPELPDDPKALCLVLLEHPKFYGYREEVLQFLADYEHGAHADAA